MMLVVDGQLQVDIFWVALQQLLGKDPKEAPLCQSPENFSWGEVLTKYFLQMYEIILAGSLSIFVGHPRPTQ